MAWMACCLRFAVLASVVSTIGCATYPTAHHLATRVPSVPGLPVQRPQCLVANHVHTLVSDRYSHSPEPRYESVAYSPAGLREVIATFKAERADAIVVTDHNSIHAQFDPILAEAPLSVLSGMEWTTRFGHALLIGFAAESAGDAILPPSWATAVGSEDFLKMVEATHARGGMVILAHPRVPFRTWPQETFGADGVEVLGLDRWFIRNRQASRWWHQQLTGGLRLVAVAGTDHHPGSWFRKLRRPLNRVSTPNCSAGEVLAAMRRGRVTLVRDRSAPTIIFGVETEGEIDFADAMEGDLISRPGNLPIELQVRIIGGIGTRLRVLGSRGEVFAGVVVDDDEAVRLRVQVQSTDFLRVELYEGRRIVGLTNPIYVRQ